MIRNFCMQCPVLIQCREYKKQTKSTTGVWGGEYHGRSS